MTQRTEKGFAVVGPDGKLTGRWAVGERIWTDIECDRLNKFRRPGHRVVPVTITWEEPQDD